MAKIKLLQQNVSELIAAGEVVERPASAIKELVENAIDAGATAIEVELKSNGLRSIRVSDNGSGIARGDVKTAFLRHATSKISSESDLNSIATLGFRGEALAAIAAVSRVRMVTKTPDEEFASEYAIEGGVERSLDDAAGKDGTTIFVEDIFYNTPARMSFLKSDVGEGNAVQTLLDQLALGNPNIAFTLIRDGKRALSSPGDGKLFSAIYAVLPRDVAENMIEVAGEKEKVRVAGYVLKPGQARRSRGFQYCYVNGRFVKSKLCVAAVEEAYKELIMAGRYPAFVLNIELPYGLVDVNVHPAKTEVRFTNDREVFGAVYGAVRAALMGFADDFGGRLRAPQSAARTAEAGDEGPGAANPELKPQTPEPPAQASMFAGGLLGFTPSGERPAVADELRQRPAAPARSAIDIWPADYRPEPLAGPTPPVLAARGEEVVLELRVLGEVLTTYIVAEFGDSMVLIDKHAAHERLLFEQIDVAGIHSARQLLLAPVVVSVSREEKEALARRAADVEAIGFVVEPFGDTEVAVREVPTYMPEGGVAGAIEEIAEQLLDNKQGLEPTETRWLLHSSACRAAIKAGHTTSQQELVRLCNDIIANKIPMFCPHGRPVLVVMDKKELEKRFGRIQ